MTDLREGNIYHWRWADWGMSVLDGRQPRELTLEQMRKPLPLDWAEQKDLLLQSDHQARQPGKQGIHGSNRKC